MQERWIRNSDRAIEMCLYGMILCLPFTKAGLEIFIWLGFLLWLLKRAWGYRTSGPWGLLPRTPLNKALAVFLIVNAVATVLSVHFGLSLRALLGKELKYLVVFFMVVETIHDEQRIKRILMVLLGSAGLMALDAAVQYVRGVDLLRSVESARVTASFSNPNDFAGWLIMFILVLMGAAWVRAIKDLTWRIRAAFIGMALVLAVCLLLTYSRGAWLGFFAGLILWGQYVFRNLNVRMKGLALLGIVFVLLAGQMFSSRIVAALDREGDFKAKFGETLHMRIKSISDTHAMSTEIRIKLWKEALSIWQKFPVAGAGLNTYTRVSPRDKAFFDSGIYPHNSYLQMAAETGVLGLGAFIWILLVFFKTAWRHIERHQDYLLLGLICGIFSFLVHSCVDSNLYQLPLAVLFWFMLGLSVAVMRVQENSD